MKGRKPQARIWKLIIFISTVVSIGLSFYFVNRETESIAPESKLAVGSARIPVPSEETKAILTNYILSNSNIEGMNIGRVDFRLNERAATWFYHREPDLQQAWVEWGDKVAPLFTDDESMNQRLVSLINGQFGCVPIESSVAYMAVPLLRGHTTTICQAAIPPEFGDFVGWINVYLYQAPSMNEADKLESDLKIIAREFYERDVLKKDD